MKEQETIVKIDYYNIVDEKTTFEGSYEYKQCIKAMKEAVSQAIEITLREAAENAIIDMKEGMDYYCEDYVEGVNKDSILNLKDKLVENLITKDIT